jgi:hypothetical protein
MQRARRSFRLCRVTSNVACVFDGMRRLLRIGAKGRSTLKYLQFMTRTDGPRIAYLARAFGAALLGTILMATLVSLILPREASQGAGDTAATPSLTDLLVIWPIVSTLVLWAVLAGVKRATPTYWHAAGTSALVFFALFTFGAGVQTGLIFVWPYFLYSLTFLAWQLESDLDAVIMTGLLQSAVMSLPALIISSQG